MRTPVHADLIRDIQSASVAPSAMCLWWLGQHSFVLKTATATVYIDPFLSDHGKRRVPPLLHAAEITDADIIIGTHDHRDHIDREVWPDLAKASPQARFVVPDCHREALIRDLPLSGERLIGVDAGSVLDIAGVRIHVVPAAHEFLSREPATGRHPFIGVIVEAEGCQIYHPGDTCLYEGIHGELRPFSLAAALLPINGRDAERLARNCLGNITFQEAADLAGVLKPRVTIPTHFDMFLGNMEDPRNFTDYMRVKYPDLATLTPEYGVRIDVQAREASPC